MYYLGKTSRRRRDTCTPRIITFCDELIKIVDYTVLCGHRGEVAQNKAYNNIPRRSSKRWPNSLHNRYPSPAIDLSPWPVDWEDRERFAYFAGYAMRTAQVLGIKMIWGADWDSDFNIQEHRLIDMPHFEEVNY